MSNKSPLTLEQLEARLARWEKWFYLCLGAAVIMLLQGLIKYYENTNLTDILFALDEEVNIFEFMYTYSYKLSMVYLSPGGLSMVYLSPWRLLLWLAVEIAALAPAAILGLASRWRKVALSKRLDLIAGFLLAGWLDLLALGATDPLNVGAGYSVVVILYLLLLGGGYWALRHQRDQAEEIFP